MQTTPFALQRGHGHSYPVLEDKQQAMSWAVIVVLGLALLYGYWNMFLRISSSWDSPQYSHGWLIPVFAAVLIYLRRETFCEVPAWHRWVGVALVLGGFALRIFGAATVAFSVDNVSFIPCLVGIFVIVGGLPTLRWAMPAILFLIFMYPLPRVLEEGLMHPLQRLATACSHVALVTFGLDTFRDGNTIFIGEHKLNVAEACSGLRMLTIFSALAVAMALISTTRPLWERLIIMLSAIPIALAVNIVRITVTGLLYSLNLEQEVINLFFHDAAGWIMMPMALGLLFLETQILSRLVIDSDEEAGPINLAGPRPA